MTNNALLNKFSVQGIVALVVAVVGRLQLALRAPPMPHWSQRNSDVDNDLHERVLGTCLHICLHTPRPVANVLEAFSSSSSHWLTEFYSSVHMLIISTVTIMMLWDTGFISDSSPCTPDKDWALIHSIFIGCRCTVLYHRAIGVLYC